MQDNGSGRVSDKVLAIVLTGIGVCKENYSTIRRRKARIYPKRSTSRGKAVLPWPSQKRCCCISARKASSIVLFHRYGALRHEPRYVYRTEVELGICGEIACFDGEIVTSNENGPNLGYYGGHYVRNDIHSFKQRDPPRPKAAQ